MRNKDNEHLSYYYTNKEVRKQIDKCLHQINANYAQLHGTDSTKDDLLKIQEFNEPLKERIKELDLDFYNTIYL